MIRAGPTIDFRDRGKSTSAKEHFAAERLVGQLMIQAIQENGAYLQAMRQSSVDVTVAILAEFAEVRRSLRWAGPICI
jgi:hypothetical protein